MSFRLVKSYQFFTSIVRVGEVHGLAVDVLVDVLDLVQAGMRLAVGRDQAVAAEVVVAGRAGRAEVAAVGPEGLLAGLDLLKVRQRQRAAAVGASPGPPSPR